MRAVRGILAGAALIAVAAFGQDRTQWRTSADVVEGARGSIVGTVSDLQEGRSRMIITPDASPYDRITVDADTVSTQYNGFGGTINGAPEIFVGSTGFANLRVGDRVEVRGIGGGNGVVRADRVTLLGRPIPASQTGIGQTRTPASVSTPTARGTTPTTAPDQLGRVEGIVRQVNPDDGRITIETDRRQMLTVRGTSATPVYYRGDTYRLSNLEPGDRIRVDPESGTIAAGSEIRARSIEVTASAQEGGAGTARQVGMLVGRVTRVERGTDTITVDTGRNSVRVDVGSATDPSGRPVRGRDIQAGDNVSMSGTYSGSIFVASTIRFTELPPDQPGTVTSRATDAGVDLGAVTIYGAVQTSLANGPQLVLRDTQSNNRIVRVYALEDLVVRTRSGGYTTADRLKEGDAVVVKAYRDADGNLIAQTIRMR